jgi:hypothetical protein
VNDVLGGVLYSYTAFFCVLFLVGTVPVSTYAIGRCQAEVTEKHCR